MTDREQPPTADESLRGAVAKLAEVATTVTLRTSDGEMHVVNLATGETGVDQGAAEDAVARALDDVIDHELTDEQRVQVRQEFEQAIARSVRERHEKRVNAEQNATSMRLFAVEQPPAISTSTFKLKAPKGNVGEIDSDGEVGGAARIAVASGLIDPVDLVHLPIGSRVRFEIDAYVTDFTPSAVLEDEDGTIGTGKISHVLEPGRVRITGIRRKGQRAAQGDVKVGPKIVNVPAVDTDGPA